MSGRGERVPCGLMKTFLGEEGRCWMSYKNGDPLAFKAIYEKHWDKLFNFSYNMLREEDDCKDLLQDFFAQLWINRFSIPVPDNGEAFLVALLKHRLIDFLRKKHIRDRHTLLYELLQAADTQGEAAEPLLFREELEKFSLFVSQLPEQLRSVFKMYHYDALPIAEIAALSAKSEQTVRNQLNLASGRLRSQLKGSFPLLLL